MFVLWCVYEDAPCLRADAWITILSASCASAYHSLIMYHNRLRGDCAG